MSADVFSKVARRMWGDDKFCALSAPPPNARDLWIYLLTGPHNTTVPGLFVKGELALAEDLDWDPVATRSCLEEIVVQGMARIDRRRKLVWLPNAIQHNLPRSPKNVLGWATAWHIMPECALKEEAAAAIRAHLAAKNVKLAEAFDRVVRGEVAPGDEPAEEENSDAALAGNQDGIQTGSKMPSKMASQEKEKEKEKKKEITTTSPAGARVVQPKAPEPIASQSQEPSVATSNVPNHAPASESHALPPSRPGNDQSDAGSRPAAAAPAGPDLIAMAHELAEAGNGFGRKMADHAALGKSFSPGQKETIRKVYAEHFEGLANAVRSAAIRSDSGPPTPRSGHAAPFRVPSPPMTYEAQEAQRRRMGHREPPPPPTRAPRPATGEPQSGGARG